jgi:hypothetical protein
MGGSGERGGGGFENAVILGTELVRAKTKLSPFAIARQKRAGRFVFKGEEGGRVFLEVGEVAIAEGRIVKRGGRHFFKLDRLLTAMGGKGGALP